MDSIDVLQKTFFIDLDGCVFAHNNTLPEIISKDKLDLNPGVLKKFEEWHYQNHKIILCTARSESCREITEKQLRNSQLFWDLLIMGVNNGKRVLINDLKPNYEGSTAVAYNLKRDEGFGSITD